MYVNNTFNYCNVIASNAPHCGLVCETSGVHFAFISSINLYFSESSTISPTHLSSNMSEASSIVGESDKKGGRLPGLMASSLINHNGKNYCVVCLRHKGNDVQFVIDESNMPKVFCKTWHLSSGKYIATNVITDDNKVKELYLHNFLKESELASSPSSCVTHINHNNLDNRSENLRVISQDEYQQGKSKRKRTITLPTDCGFLADDIPKYISFMKASGEHGDRFVIEIPKLNIFRKLTSSKKKSLKDKLQEAIQILDEIYKEYPFLNSNITEQEKESLTKSYNEILDKYFNSIDFAQKKS